MAEFQAEWESFTKSNPYAAVIELDTKTHTDVHKVIQAKPLPKRLSGIAFDIANALRSALDQAGHVVGVAAGTNGANAHFPFGNSETNVRGMNGKKGRSRDLPKEIFDLMVTFKPYKGGDDLLWSLNKLANTPKHETILGIDPHFSVVGNSRIGRIVASGSFRWPPRWDRAKNEMIVAHTPIGEHTEYEFEAALHVEIANIPPLAGKPADAVFNAMAGKVESIVNGIEAEARRLAIIT
jgi:hypothetical protein